MLQTFLYPNLSVPSIAEQACAQKNVFLYTPLTKSGIGGNNEAVEDDIFQLQMFLQFRHSQTKYI